VSYYNHATREDYEEPITYNTFRSLVHVFVPFFWAGQLLDNFRLKNGQLLDNFRLKNRAIFDGLISNADPHELQVT